MSLFALDDMVQVARRRAAVGLHRRPIVRLCVLLGEDGLYAATSPDLDWLVVTSPSRIGARLNAMVALMRVANWCGSRVWQSDGG